jgi:hypothetical protein
MNTDRNSDKPMYDGLCASAVSTGKTDVKGGKHTLHKDGKTYVFSNLVAKLLFKILPNRAEKAADVWNKRGIK